MKKQKIQNTNKGITLIALVITIIVMLILVAVTISMAVNGGLFEYAQSAGRQTNEKAEAEQELANLEANMTVDELIDKYTVGTGNGGTGTGGTGTGIVIGGTYTEAEKDGNGFLTENATYISGGYTAVIPEGFKVSEVEGESTITTGLVIKDAQGNEFVWIPVTKTLQNSYSFAEGYLEPAEVEADEGKGYNFTSEYEAMVTSVNTNNGFYIGRYETTIDANSKVGSKYNTSILNSDNWYDLYNAQKTANVSGNGTNVQTAMVYGVLWDETVAYITEKDPNYDIQDYNRDWTYYYSKTACNAGTINVTDITLNIWGLGSCFKEWTQESTQGLERTPRGETAWWRSNLYIIGGTIYKPQTTTWYLPEGAREGTLASRLIMYAL